MTRGTAEGLASALAGLSSLDTPALKERWQALFGKDPPHHASRGFLIRAVAYRMQENALGGLKPQTRRLLVRLADGTRNPAAPKLGPGTRLVREWQGVPHQVLVLEDGVVYRGQHYRSLSEVARLITGSRRSGPLFFGLKSKGGGNASP